MSSKDELCSTTDAASSPIRALQLALTAEFERDARGPRAAALLVEYAEQHDDWRAFAHFAANQYTRNLVGRTAHYELLVLCWDSGQSSPIHDHSGENCWMAVLDGRIEEVQYAWPVEGQTGALSARSARTYEKGKVAHIHDDVALHLVRAADARRGVSLHLYARPIAACNVYDAETGRVLPRVLTYHTG